MDEQTEKLTTRGNKAGRMKCKACGEKVDALTKPHGLCGACHSEGVEQQAQERPAKRRKTTGEGNTSPKDNKAPKKKTSTPKRKGGRTPAWVAIDMPSKLESVRGWAMQGATMDEIGDMLGVATSVLYEWQKKGGRQYKAEFAEAIRAGRYVATGELLASAFKQSTGFLAPSMAAVKVKRWELLKDDNGNVMMDAKGSPIKVQNEYVEMVEVSEYVEPDARITQFMLKNWLPDQFRDKQEIEHSDREAPTFVDDLSGKGEEE